MKQVGKIGNLNIKARKKIADFCREHNITACEIHLDGCMGEAHAPAHRRKRVEYRSMPDEALWHPSEWVAACQSCHSKMERDAELTKKVFDRLRPEDYLELKKRL